jgi:hypothetical protein
MSMAVETQIIKIEAAHDNFRSRELGNSFLGPIGIGSGALFHAVGNEIAANHHWTTGCRRQNQL